MDLVQPHQNHNQIREKNFPFIIELTVPLPECIALSQVRLPGLRYDKLGTGKRKNNSTEFKTEMKT